MSARFRIRTSLGQELSFASHDMFAEFVRSGDLSPEDVVYDAETKEWSSALTHPVVLQIRLDAEESAEEDSGSPDKKPAPTPAAEDGDDDVGLGSVPAAPLGLGMALDLAPEEEGLSPDEEAAVFVAKMEAERAADVDALGDQPLLAFTMEQAAPRLSEAPPEPAPRVALEPAPPPRREAHAPSPPPVREVYEPPRQEKKKEARAAPGAGWKYAPFVIVGVALVAAGVYFGPEILDSRAGPGEGTDTQGTVAPPTPPPLIPDTEPALRQRARERFLTATQTALRGLDPIPDVWLTGLYLAGPSDYPSVRATWEVYLTTIQEVRAGESERYRTAYERALDDARVADSLRAARAARADADFQASAGPRDAHWDRAEALATAAIQGHDALVRAEGTIAYQPAAGPALSADPVIEAVGRGPEAQALLNEVLDLILSRVHEPGGPGRTANVREWIWVGFLNAVAG